MDRFLVNRIEKWVQSWRARTGELPTLQDFEAAQISKETVDQAVRVGVLEKFYVTLTSGVIKKGYKLGSKTALKP